MIGLRLYCQGRSHFVQRIKGKWLCFFDRGQGARESHSVGARGRDRQLRCDDIGPSLDEQIQQASTLTYPNEL